jgi:hypothetical protein
VRLEINHFVLPQRKNSIVEEKMELDVASTGDLEDDVFETEPSGSKEDLAGDKRRSQSLSALPKEPQSPMTKVLKEFKS